AAAAADAVRVDLDGAVQPHADRRQPVRLRPRRLPRVRAQPRTAARHPPGQEPGRRAVRAGAGPCFPDPPPGVRPASARPPARGRPANGVDVPYLLRAREFDVDPRTGPRPRGFVPRGEYQLRHGDAARPFRLRDPDVILTDAAPAVRGSRAGS